MLIKTPSMAARESTQDVGVDDITALKHIWFPSGVSSGVSITDGKGGVVAADASITRSGSDPYFTANAASITGGSLTGTLSDIGTSDCLLVMAGQMVSNEFRFAYGNNSTGGVSMYQTNIIGQHIIDDGTTAVTFSGAGLTGASASTDYTILAACDRDGSGTASRYLTTSGTADSTANASITTANGDLTLTQELRIEGQFNGIGVFVFTAGLPDDWLGTALWMAGQWRDGNEVVPYWWSHL